jgi:hypothetical protein
LKPNGHRWPRRVGLVTLAAIVLLVAAVLFGTSALLDLPSVKSEAQRELSQAVNGHIAWDTLQFRLLLRPRIVLRGVAVDFPGHASAQIEQAEVGLRLRPLLLGHVEFNSASVSRPVIRIDIPPSAPEENPQPTDPVAIYRSLLEPLLRVLRKAAPDSLIEIADGELELRAPALPSVQVRAISLRAQTGVSGIELQVSGASDLWDNLNFVGRAEFSDLSGDFRLEVAGLRPQAWLNRALSDTTIGIGIPRAALHAQVRTDAKSVLQCDFGIDIASMSVAREGPGLPISNVHFAGTAALRAHESDVTLQEIRLGSLLPAGHATLHLTSDAQKDRATLDIPRLDAGALRDAVLALAPDSDLARRHAPRVFGGDITDLQLHAEADTWRDLLGSDHVAGTATLAQGSFLLPVIEQRATALGGRIVLSDATLELAAASAQMGLSRLSDARLRYSMRDKATSASIGVDLDLAQGLAVARSVLPQALARSLQEVESTQGRLQGRVNIASAKANWTVRVDVTQSNASVRLRPLPWPVSLSAAKASFAPGQASVSGLHGALGRSDFADVGVAIALGPEPRITSGYGRATLALEEIYPWVRSQGHFADLLRDIDSISGSVQITLDSLSGALAQPSALAFAAIVRPEQIRVAATQLPAPLTVAGGTVHIDPSTIALDRVTTAMLDAQGLVSGEIVDYRGSRLQLRARVVDAVVGEEFASWIWQRMGAPVALEPRTPLRFSLEQVIWSPNEPVQAQGDVKFDAGPDVSADLRWGPELLDVRRLVIRDGASQATLGLQLKDHLFQANYSGTLFARSIASMLKRPGGTQGQVAGDLRVTFDPEHWEKTSAQGHILAQSFDLDGLLHAPVSVERLDLSASGSSLQIHEAVLRWAQQLAKISGELARGEEGLVVNAELDSPGIVVDALLRAREAAAQAPAGAQDQPTLAQGAGILARVWAMPITGQIKVRSDSLQFHRYRLAPLGAILTLGKEKAELRLHDTDLCGVSLPMTIAATPAGLTGSAQLLALNQHLETVTHCLTEGRLLITGEFDARVNLRAKGTLDGRLTDLEGTIQFESRDGEVRKFALIGNILAMTDVIGLLSRNSSSLGAEGFPYRTLTIEGPISERQFLVKEMSFDSGAFGLAGTGTIRLLDGDTDLTVLFAPHSRLDRLVRNVPIIGYLVGGTLTSVPMEVTGDIRDPTVVPLDPRAIASGITSLLTRVLRLPGKLLEPFGSGSESNTQSPGP